MKICKGCKNQKQISAFSKHSQMADGHLNYCKICIHGKIDRIKQRKSGERARRKRGIPTVDETLAEHLIKGRQAEKLVAEKLNKIGLSATLGNGRKGPDIFVHIGGQTLSIEVKTTFKHQKCNTFYVSRVEPDRVHDHYVAIVHKNRVFIETMADHLAKCSAGGKRCVTTLVKDQFQRDCKVEGKNNDKI